MASEPGEQSEMVTLKGTVPEMLVSPFQQMIAERGSEPDTITVAPGNTCAMLLSMINELAASASVYTAVKQKLVPLPQRLMS